MPNGAAFRCFRYEPFVVAEHMAEFVGGDLFEVFVLADEPDTIRQAIDECYQKAGNLPGCSTVFLEEHTVNKLRPFVCCVDMAVFLSNEKRDDPS